MSTESEALEYVLGTARFNRIVRGLRLAGMVLLYVVLGLVVFFWVRSATIADCSGTWDGALVGNRTEVKRYELWSARGEVALAIGSEWYQGAPDEVPFPVSGRLEGSGCYGESFPATIRPSEAVEEIQWKGAGLVIGRTRDDAEEGWRRRITWVVIPHWWLVVLIGATPFANALVLLWRVLRDRRQKGAE